MNSDRKVFAVSFGVAGWLPPKLSSYSCSKPAEFGKSSSFMLSSFRHSGVNSHCSTAPARSIDSSGCGLVGLKFVGNEWYGNGSDRRWVAEIVIHRRRWRNTCSLLSLLIKKMSRAVHSCTKRITERNIVVFVQYREKVSLNTVRACSSPAIFVLFSSATRMLQMLQRWCVKKVIKRYCIALSHSDTRQVKRCKWCSRFTQQGIRVCCKWWRPWYHRGTPACSGWSPFLRRGGTVNHIDDPLSVARSSTHLVFGGALSLILSAVSLSSSALSLLTACCTDLIRDSSGSWCVWDTICSTRDVVILTDEVYSRFDSRLGFPRPRPPRRTGSARTFLSSCLHLCSVIAEVPEILHSPVALVGPGCPAVFLKSKSIGVLTWKCRQHSTPVAASKRTPPTELLYWPNETPSNMLSRKYKLLFLLLHILCRLFSLDWFSRERRKHWPPEHVVERIRSRGCHVVPKASVKGTLLKYNACEWLMNAEKQSKMREAYIIMGNYKIFSKCKYIRIICSEDCISMN